MMVDAVVLAGGVERGPLAAQTGVLHRALLEVGGEPIVRRLAAALRGSVEVDRVALVAPPPVQAEVGDEAVDFRVPAGDSFVENIVNGVSASDPGNESVLVVTGDLPFLTPEAVNDFVRQSLASGAEVTYAIIPRESCERRFPGGHRTYVRLREGTFTGGNAVMLSRGFVARQRELLGRLYASRKNPLRLAGLLGVPFIVGLLTHRLRLPQLEARAAALVGARVAAIITAFADIGFDVDKPEDLALARRVAGGG